MKCAMKFAMTMTKFTAMTFEGMKFTYKNEFREGSLQ